MTEQNKTKVPAELIPAGDYPVVSTDAVMDKQKGKTQEEVNTEADEKIEALEESVGSGGSVDTRIENAVNTEKARAENVEAQLSNEIDVLQKQDIVPVDSLPSVADADPKKIYRVVGTTSYTDYMVDTMANPTAWKTLATYSFPGIDDEPTAGSENLVKSRGVAGTLGFCVENPEWIRVITDSENKILCGIKADGSIEWSAGVPKPVKDYVTQKIDELNLDEYEDIVAFLNNLEKGDKTLQTLLNEKVDKEEGKSLINSQYAASKSIEESIELLSVECDQEGKMLGYTRKDGSHYLMNLNSESLDILRALDKFPTTVFVASSEAPESIKKAADYVCDGINDEVEINMALRVGGANAKVVLSEGSFYIDSFNEYQNNYYCAICLPVPSELHNSPSLIGVNNRGTKRTSLIVNATAFENIPENADTNLIGQYGGSYDDVTIKSIYILLPDNRHKICCIDLSHLGSGELIDITCIASNNGYQDHIPIEGCIAYRSFHGSDAGTRSYFRGCLALGFYEGFQLGAEHHVLVCCGARFCYYGYTFGNYNYHLGENTHPITLINCCDEHSVYLPKFVQCGYYDINSASYVEHPKQAVCFYTFNLEAGSGFPGTTQHPAEEVRPGDWCGYVEYSAGAGVYNKVDFTFWASGSGLCFKTINLSHALGGSSAIRNTYTPQYLQTYYDTDLSKLLIYTGEGWSDAMGNRVS